MDIDIAMQRANKGLKRCRSRRYADGGLSLHNCFVTAFARLVAAARTSGGRDAIEWAQLYEWRALVEFQMEWRNADDEAHVAVEMALGRMCAPSKPELALLDHFFRLPLAEPRVLMRATFYRCCTRYAYYTGPATTAGEPSDAAEQRACWRRARKLRLWAEPEVQHPPTYEARLQVYWSSCLDLRARAGMGVPPAVYVCARGMLNQPKPTLHGVLGVGVRYSCVHTLPRKTTVHALCGGLRLRRHRPGGRCGSSTRSSSSRWSGSSRKW